MQHVGHIITRDREAGGIVRAVGTAQVSQPPKLTMQGGVEVGREDQEPLDVQTIHGVWEDGSTFDLCEIVDTWEVVGNVVDFDRDATVPTDAQQAEIDAALADVAGYMGRVRGAAAYATAAVAADAAPTEIVEDPTFSVTVVSRQTAATPTPAAEVTSPPAE